MRSVNYPGGSAVLLCAIAAFALLIPVRMRAEHFNIKLTATNSTGESKAAFADQSPPSGGLNSRPVLTARAGSSIRIEFVMTNVYAHEDAPDAGVRYYVVQEQEIGQKRLPPIQNPVADGSFSFDLKPKARIGARQRIVIREPGSYLLRVESLRTQRDHEHFAAIDLLIR